MPSPWSLTLGLSAGWFYKWIKSPVTGRQRRRQDLDAAVRERFEASGRTCGSPRVHRDLVDDGWQVSVNTVADSMARQGLAGRKRKRRHGLTRQDPAAPKFPDLVRRDFTAPAPNVKWCGDMTEIGTDEGKLYMATVIDLYARRLLACPIGDHPDRHLAAAAVKIAAAVRGGRSAIQGVIFHTDRGSTYTRRTFRCCVRRNSGSGNRWDGSDRVSTTPPRNGSSPPLNHEVLSRHHFTAKAEARTVVGAWCHDFYNNRRRHSSAGLLPPNKYEMITAELLAAA